MEESTREHKVVIDSRKRMTVSGVDDVESFDEEKIVVLCNMGKMTVSGADLKISRLNVEAGELIIEGEIDEVQYSHEVSDRKDGGFLSKLFR